MTTPQSHVAALTYIPLHCRCTIASVQYCQGRGWYANLTTPTVYYFTPTWIICWSSRASPPKSVSSVIFNIMDSRGLQNIRVSVPYGGSCITPPLTVVLQWNIIKHSCISSKTVWMMLLQQTIILVTIRVHSLYNYIMSFLTHLYVLYKHLCGYTSTILHGVIIMRAHIHMSTSTVSCARSVIPHMDNAWFWLELSLCPCPCFIQDLDKSDGKV